jgi:uncharacterized protein
MGGAATVVQGAYDAFAKGDIAAVIGMLDPAVEWSSPKTLPHGGEFRGPGEVGRFFEGIGAQWSELSLAVESVAAIDADDVVGVLRASGARLNGARESYGAVHVFTVRDGKIRRFREYVDLDAPLG